VPDEASHVSAPLIKFCGLTRPVDTQQAVALGAAFVGGIRAGGPRLLSTDAWRRTLSDVPASVARVAVLGAMSPSAVVAEVETLGADVAQLHGDPTASDVAHLSKRGLQVWPVLRVAGFELPREAWALSEHADALVLDALVHGQLGGTGVALNWQALGESVERWRSEFPNVQLVLAGGLHADNVAHAIRLLAPDVVDVSSGVEIAPGIKDPERMRAFADAVRGSH
jgi:phosphoribosylanthranilate isomerase